MKTIIRWAILSFVGILLFSAGYFGHDILGEYEYGFHDLPTVPKLPKQAPEMFLKYQEDHSFTDLNMAGWKYNEYLRDFYNAWKEKETFGAYEIGWGLDDLVHMYWLTKDGKVYRFCISDHGTFTIAKTYWVDESETVSIVYFNDCGDKPLQKVPMDPDSLNQSSPFLDGEFPKSSRRFIQ